VYRVKAKWYSESDQFGETFVLQSDNDNEDLRLEAGTTVAIVPLESFPGGEPLQGGSFPSPYWVVDCWMRHLLVQECCQEEAGGDPCGENGECITEWCAVCVAKKFTEDRRDSSESATVWRCAKCEHVMTEGTVKAFQEICPDCGADLSIKNALVEVSVPGREEGIPQIHLSEEGENRQVRDRYGPFQGVDVHAPRMCTSTP